MKKTARKGFINFSLIFEDEGEAKQKLGAPAYLPTSLPISQQLNRSFNVALRKTVRAVRDG